MAKRRRISRHRAAGGRRGFRILDSFTEADLEIWSQRSFDAARYSNAVYFDLEKQRVAHHDELVDALRSAGGIKVPIRDWVRVTDYKWSHMPLSAGGSIKRIGGRFNVGEDLHLRAKPFSALYIAHDFETAMFEFFGGPPKASALKAHELLLRGESSIATIMLEGEIENVLDLREIQKLGAFVSIIKNFTLTNETRAIARRAGLKQYELVRTTKSLKRMLNVHPNRWRLEPLMADVPAPTQIFARYVVAAGYEGLLYESQQGGTLCMAVFPQNFANSESYLQVKGDCPPGAICTRLDRNNLCLDGVPTY